MGKTLELDYRTVQQEFLIFSRVKVLRDDLWDLSKAITLWLDDLKVPVQVEQDMGDCLQEGSPNPLDFMRFHRTDRVERCGSCDSNRECSETQVEDDDVTSPISNFKPKSAIFESNTSGSEWDCLTRSVDLNVEAQYTSLVVGLARDGLSIRCRSELSRPFSTLLSKVRGGEVIAMSKVRASMPGANPIRTASLAGSLPLRHSWLSGFLDLSNGVMLRDGERRSVEMCPISFGHCEYGCPMASAMGEL